MGRRIASSHRGCLRLPGTALLLLAALLAAPACAPVRCPAPGSRPAPGTRASTPDLAAAKGAGVAIPSARPVGGHERAAPYAFYEGASGRPSDLEAFVHLAEGASLIAFGELHGDPVGSTMELRLLEALVDGQRPVALALEFFERDMQGDLDAYLAGRTTEAEFLRSTRRDDAYARTHRPLIELCRERGIPVIAANAPRRLVSAYRESGQTYPEYLAGLGERERSYLPTTTTILDDRHRERFVQLMGPERGAKLFKSMSLWDDAMAESVALFQQTHPTYRVLLIVGSFHVTERLGTITKYLARAPEARAKTLLMSFSIGDSLAFEDSDKGMGDVLLKVRPAAPRRPAE